MSDYTKLVDYASKDALTSGDPNKVVRGIELDAEFEAIETAVATKADLTSPAFLGSPTAPTPSSNADNTLLATTAFVRDIIPAGVILMWSGSIATIPTGWLLCDGTNGTPNLRDRFVVGAGTTYAVGAAAGSKDAVVVSHTHTATSVVTDPGHSHTINAGSLTAGGASNERLTIPGSTPTSTNTTGITVATTVASTGVSGTDANLPPYLALAYIMKS